MPGPWHTAKQVLLPHSPAESKGMRNNRTGQRSPLIAVIFEKDFGRYLKKYSRIVHTVLLTYLLFSGEFLGIDIIQQMMITVFSLSGMALLLILCVVFMLADHSDKSMNRNHIRNSMFPMILMIVDVIILGNAEQFYCATLIALIVLAYMIWEYQGSVKIKICYASVIIMTIIGIYLWHRISYLSGPILEEWFNGIRVKYIAHSWGLGKYCEYGLIFIILAIVLIYMYRVTRQYLRSEDRMIMHYALCMDSLLCGYFKYGFLNFKEKQGESCHS